MPDYITTDEANRILAQRIDELTTKTVSFIKANYPTDFEGRCLNSIPYEKISCPVGYAIRDIDVCISAFWKIKSSLDNLEVKGDRQVMSILQREMDTLEEFLTYIRNYLKQTQEEVEIKDTKI